MHKPVERFPNGKFSQVVGEPFKSGKTSWQEKLASMSSSELHGTTFWLPLPMKNTVCRVSGKLYGLHLRRLSWVCDRRGRNDGGNERKDDNKTRIFGLLPGVI